MRHYETNSTPAAARLLALTVLADGGLDRNEVDTMMHTDLARRLGRPAQDSRGVHRRADWRNPAPHQQRGIGQLPVC